MCFFSRSGYRPHINPPPSLGNLLLDITLLYVQFHSGVVLFVFFVNFSVRVRFRVSYRVGVRV